MRIEGGLEALNRAVALDCRALPLVRAAFSNLGIAAFAQTVLASERVDRLSGRDTLVHFFLDAPLVAQAVANSGIRRIIVAGPGAGTIDDPAILARHGIALYDTPGRTVRSVAEHTLALLFALSKNLGQASGALAQGQWPRLVGRELLGQTVGLIGFGAVAREVATLCRALGMAVWVHASPARREEILAAQCKPVALADLLGRCDVVSIHKRLAEDTRQMLSAQLLALMRADAFLINTSRAELVDEQAMLDALDNGRLAGAALDVFSSEPLPLDSTYRTHERIIATPHSAWLTDGAVNRLVAAVHEFLLGNEYVARRIH